MKILVTGGAGFIGANLVRMLIEKSYKVMVFDDLSACGLHYVKSLDLEFIQGSILSDPDRLYKAIEWSDSVIHLAAQTSVIDSVSHPYNDFQTNMIGTLNVLRFCREAGTKRLVFISSSAAKQYGLSPYGASKRAAEGYCLAYNATYGLETVILRLANVYGPYSTHKNSVVAKWLKSIADKKEVIIEGGEQTRDFIHVADVCRAIIAALESNVSGEIFQVGTGIETSISKLATTITRQIDGVKVTYGEGRKNDASRHVSNISKTGLMLKWQPSIKLTDGLQATWEWFNDNRRSYTKGKHNDI